jgi:hypothetical protein
MPTHQQWFAHIDTNSSLFTSFQKSSVSRLIIDSPSTFDIPQEPHYYSDIYDV